MWTITNVVFDCLSSSHDNKFSISVCLNYYYYTGEHIIVV